MPYRGCRPRQSVNGVSQSNFPGVNPVLLGTHTQCSEHFMIGSQLCVDIRQLFSVSERFALSELTYVIVDGNQYILNKLFVRVLAGSQGVLLGYYAKCDPALRVSR
jgi:hypothetical protein